MTSPDTPLKTQSVDPTEDSGPRYRGGPLTFLLAFSSSLLALGLCVALWHEERKVEAALCLMILGYVGLRASWCLVENLRHRGSLPHSHAVLTDHLGFRIDFTCRDVAMSAFLSPDSLQAGGSTQLLCFVENYASRRRVAEFSIGPHPKLGLPSRHQVKLHLAAGQAAVYALPLRIATDLAPGQHDLPIELTVTRPSGAGMLLPGVRRHLHNLWTVHYATPFTVLEGAAPAADRTAAPEPRYLSLGSVSETAPTLEALQSLLS